MRFYCVVVVSYSHLRLWPWRRLLNVELALYYQQCRLLFFFFFTVDLGRRAQQFEKDVHLYRGKGGSASGVREFLSE